MCATLTPCLPSSHPFSTPPSLTHSLTHSSLLHPHRHSLSHPTSFPHSLPHSLLCSLPSLSCSLFASSLLLSSHLQVVMSARSRGSVEEEEFLSWFDVDGRLVREASMRQAVFEGDYSHLSSSNYILVLSHNTCVQCYILSTCYFCMAFISLTVLTLHSLSLPQRLWHRRVAEVSGNFSLGSIP